MTVEQALSSALQLDLSDVLIIGYGDDGKLKIRSSKMDRKNALWLIESVKKDILE